MLDRLSVGGAEADQRRHWLLAELPQLWCEFTQRHYLGPARALARMQSEAEPVYRALERALAPGASVADIERAVHEIAGERDPNRPA